MDENGTGITAIETANRERTLIKLWQVMGATKLANQIVTSLGAQSVHALEMVRDDKLYLATDYPTFESFMDSHPESQMSYEQFRRRSNLLKTEGDITFDLLTSLAIPLSQRKLLAGQIEVTDNEIKIGEATTRLDDGPRIVELISKLHAKNLEQQRTITRKDKKLAQGEKDFETLKRQVVVANPDGTETGQALLTAAGALKNLRDKLEDASAEEKQALREQIFELLTHSQFELSAALGIIDNATVGGGPTTEDDPLNVDESEAAAMLEED